VAARKEVGAIVMCSTSFVAGNAWTVAGCYLQHQAASTA